jgi:hypothetical protein
VFTRAKTKFFWGKSPARLNSTIDVEDVLAKWKVNLSMSGGKSKGNRKAMLIDVKRSDDVGNYVCGFVYYASLEWFWKRPQGKRPVVFFHVPKLGGKAGLDKGKEVAVSLIKAVIESCGI